MNLERKNSPRSMWKIRYWKSKYHRSWLFSCYFSDGELYSGTVADFSASDSLIIKDNLRTEQYDFKQLNGKINVSSTPKMSLWNHLLLKIFEVMLLKLWQRFLGEESLPIKPWEILWWKRYDKLLFGSQ